MAKPNYNFEKRQRDLAKKKQQDEKRQKKLAKKAEGGSAEGADDAEASPDGDDVPAAETP